MSEPNFNLLWQGFFIGLAIAAPVGPTSILCLQTAITKGIVPGFFSGAGAATAHTIQASIGAFGLNLVASSLTDNKGWFHLISGIFLCYLGVKIALSRYKINGARADLLLRDLSSENVLLGDYSAALFLTIINPLAILPFIAFFTKTYPTVNHSNYIWTGAFVLGVFVSSVLWYGLISVVINLFSQRVLLRWLPWVNRISGTAIGIFGCASIYSAWS